MTGKMERYATSAFLLSRPYVVLYDFLVCQSVDPGYQRPYYHFSSGVYQPYPLLPGPLTSYHARARNQSVQIRFCIGVHHRPHLPSFHPCVHIRNNLTSATVGVVKFGKFDTALLSRVT